MNCPGANQTITKYYYAGSQRIAMRTNGTLNYLLGDHLGSTSLITNSAGDKTNEQRYKAWGDTRYTFGNEKTKYQYTGQFSYESDFGLMYYGARWYDSSLGRFAQADTIIPPTQGVQAWDRYAYGNNNPVQYIDPTGHDGIPVSKLSPFAYNTLQGSIRFSLEALGGGSLDIGLAINLKAVKDTITNLDVSYMNEFDAALTVSTSITVGLEGQAAVLPSLTGMDQSIDELITDNVSTVFDGEVPINVSICDGWCVGAGATVDVGNPDVINSVTWSLGGGAGAEAGVDLVTATEWLAYGSADTTDGHVVLNGSALNPIELFNEAWNDLKHDWEYFEK